MLKRAYAHYKDHPLEITDRRMIQQIDRLTNSTDAKLIILSFRIDTYQRSAINAYCKDRCMHIDLEKEIDYNQHDPLMILHEEDRHPSPYLHNLTAHYIKKKLEEKRLI